MNVKNSLRITHLPNSYIHICSKMKHESIQSDFESSYRVLFSLGLPLKCLSTKKLIKARLGVSGPIYVNVDSPHLGFPYYNFLG